VCELYRYVAFRYSERFGLKFLSGLLSRKQSKPESRPESERDDIGFGPTVRCKKKGHFYDFEWTYKEDGVLGKPKCKGCGMLFDYDGDEDHAVFIIS